MGIRKVNRKLVYDSSSEDSDGSYVFSGGKKRKYIVPDSQFDFDDQDLALAGNVHGIGNLATFSIPEIQMENSDRSVRNFLRT